MKINLDPPLADFKARELARIDTEAAERSAAIMPLHELLALIAEAIDAPAGPARQKLADWRAGAARIETARQNARAALEAASTVSEARTRAKPGWPDG